jgi:3-oxoacyl-[acyl-carrier protein] reductase
MDLGLSGKKVLITGASRGIGLAAARAFDAEGARLVLHYAREPAGAGEIDGALLLQADLKVQGAASDLVAAAATALGGLDVLINNAGHMLGRARLEEIDDERIDAVFDLNARSVIEACKAALPALRHSRGCIINVSSISARTGGSAGSSLYSGSKAFVSSLTRSLATELADDGIRVNAVSPGTILTHFHEIYSTPEKLEATAGKTPMRRNGTAEDCAGAFLFLASPALSGYITGQIIEVNGGALMP